MKLQAAFVALCIGLAGCSKMTLENYAKLQTGMPYAEVTALLGTPQSCDDTLGFKSCKWGDDKSHVTAKFVGDKLVLHSAENLH